ncbi:hypothetical protein FCOIX_13391 [Fusarium coicis]|nr:hypothetical protein FCOIX_13391 [Fusarium coicis]
MAIFTGGPSVAIDSPRHLTLRHARNAVAQAKQQTLLKAASLEVQSGEAAKEPPDPQDEDQTPPLAPGQAQLHSYWAPGLEAGKEHEIIITQDIKARSGDKTLRLQAKQDFSVDAPRFVLPEGSVYSTYPPQGYPDDRRILPHIVLSDPHLPWERIGSPSADQKVDKRNKVPWLALFTFTHDELLLQPGALGETQFKQTPTQSIRMTVGDVVKIGNVATPIEKEPGPDVQDIVTEFIFVKPDLIKSFFSTFDKDNKRQVPEKPNVNQYKYLSHVRKINTRGMAIAGHEDFGIFSVVISNRCGPLNNPTAANVSVHLVSIEGIEEMSWPAAGKDYVGLCSLHSWTYTVLPPGQLNVYDAFVHLGRELNVLRPLESVFEPLQSSSDKVTARLGTRIKDGYSLVKYRVQTGEKTVALYRGPFTPTRVAHNDQFSQCSNSGQDFQILDKEVGLMDISYSIAWQIGRTLALGDRAYVAALSRLRSIIRRKAMKDSKIDAVTKTGPSVNSYRSKVDVLKSLQDTIERLQQIQSPTPPDSDEDGGAEFSPGGAQKRWYRPQLTKKEYPKLGFASKLVQGTYQERAEQAVKELSMGKDGKMYDETNDPVSTDWMVVLSWIVDRMFLDRVPAHYLISDPSHLPPEALRFFYIDPNWVDAMVDGALSLANHMGQDMDRAAIKWGINRFLKYIPPQQTHSVQIPTYGFYLRSDLVTMYPDLRVTTTGEDTGRAPLLHHDIVADGVMLGLLDCIPGKNLEELIFTQPPHQQRFAAGPNLNGDKLELSIRKQYTVDQKWHRKEDHVSLSKVDMLPSSENNWFVWSTVPKPLIDGKDKGDPDADLRILRTPYFAEQQLDIIYRGMGEFTNDKGEKQKFFDDNTPNAALLAMQLNDPYYDLIVSLKGYKKPDEAKPLAALASLQPETPQPSQELRDLRLVAASTIPRVPNSDDDDDEEEPTGATQFSLVQAAPSPEVVPHWGRDESYEARSHTLRNDTAPHVRSLFTEHLHDAMNSGTPHGVEIPPESERSDPEDPEAPRPQLRMIFAGEDPNDLGRPAAPPRYSCDVYSLQQDCIIQDENNLEQDLVFSVLVKNNEYSNYFLIEFDIALELGAEEDAKYLMETYTGPGARMLSNLRFNVLTSFTKMPVTGRKCLLLRLVPRNSEGEIRIDRVQEMSFMLTLAKLNKFARNRSFKFYTSAYYTAGHEKYPINDDFEVRLKRPDV